MYHVEVTSTIQLHYEISLCITIFLVFRGVVAMLVLLHLLDYGRLRRLQMAQPTTTLVIIFRKAAKQLSHSHCECSPRFGRG